jgi:hypothetical protein
MFENSESKKFENAPQPPKKRVLRSPLQHASHPHAQLRSYETFLFSRFFFNNFHVCKKERERRKERRQKNKKTSFVQERALEMIYIAITYSRSQVGERGR